MPMVEQASTISSFQRPWVYSSSSSAMWLAVMRRVLATATSERSAKEAVPPPKKLDGEIPKDKPKDH
ncbi:hypothetical protein ZWY2020_053479 [Hordeum vulgare]|nr:hypothetical protein ZWY2020_053479 [Hordeum vulgare]